LTDHIYKHIELTGSSPESYQKAIENALSRAAKTVRSMRWFEVLSCRGHIENNQVSHWQATIKIGFTMDD
jgi:flavin-binding protein dodecin